MAQYPDSNVALFVGGRVVGNHIRALEEINARCIYEFEQFGEKLKSLQTKSAEKITYKKSSEKMPMSLH